MGRKRRRLDERLAGIELKLGRAEQHLVDIETRGQAWVTKQES